MADLKIEEQKAIAWTMEVQTKLNAVETTLDEVRSVRNSTTGSNDTVFQMIEKAGNLMDETWTNTCDSFKRGWDILKEGLGVLGTAGQKISDAFNELQNQI